jgi:hypothetical protein
MQIRYRDTGILGVASSFNLSAKVIINDDSAFERDLDVWLEQKQCWKSMDEAFRDCDLITDDHNTHFFEPLTEADRARGYTLY